MKSKGLNPSQQILMIANKYPDLVHSYSFKTPLYINLKIRPTDSSRTYLTQIKLTGSKKIDVFIIRPKLAKENKDKNKVPHMYSLVKGKICLYMPKEINNTDDYSIIVPWISEWLFHYEIWKITGEWHGGGHRFKKGDTK